MAAARLSFTWKEKITQAGDVAARPYLKSIGVADVTPLTEAEIDLLVTKLEPFV